MRWKKEETKQLKELYPDTPNKEIAIRLNRSQYSIEMKAKNLGLKKQPKPPPPETPQTPNTFKLIDRDEVTKRDKVELLRYSWSLAELYTQELENPELSDAQRHKIMNGMGNMINIINSIMRYTPDEVFMEQPDLYQEFLKISHKGTKVRSRRYRHQQRRP